MISSDRELESPEAKQECPAVGEVSGAPCELARKGEFARLAADHNPDTVLVLDPDGSVRYAGGGIEALVGLGPTEATGASIWDFVHPADLESAAGAFNEASRNDGYHMPTEFRVRSGDGTWTSTEITGTTFGGPGGTWLVLTIRMTAHRSEVIRRREEIESLIRDASTILSGVSWMDVDAAVSTMGERLASIVGADSFSMAWMEDGELRYGAAWPSWILDVDGGRFARLWSKELLGGSLLQFTDELHTMTPSPVRDLLIVEGVRSVVEIPLTGEPLWGVARLTFRHSAAHWDDANVDLVKVLATAAMATVRRCRVERTLHDRASTDPLTGLMNRTELYRHLDEWSCDGGTNGNLAVLFADLDNFKMINDVQGHAAGDELLIRVADVLRRSVRAVDLIARLGGDEFVVVCPDVEDRHQLDSIARRVVEAVDHLDTGEILVSVSVGLAIRQAAESAHDLLRRADRHMYEVKAASPSRSGARTARF